MANTVPVRLLMAGKLLFEFNKSVRKMDPASILKIERQLVCVNCAIGQCRPESMKRAG